MFKITVILRFAAVNRKSEHVQIIVLSINYMLNPTNTDYEKKRFGWRRLLGAEVCSACLVSHGGSRSGLRQALLCVLGALVGQLVQRTPSVACWMASISAPASLPSELMRLNLLVAARRYSPPLPSFAFTNPTSDNFEGV